MTTQPMLLSALSSLPIDGDEATVINPSSADSRTYDGIISRCSGVGRTF